MEPVYVFLQGTTFGVVLFKSIKTKFINFNRWLEQDLNVQLLAKLVETAL